MTLLLAQNNFSYKINSFKVQIIILKALQKEYLNSRCLSLSTKNLNFSKVGQLSKMSRQNMISFTDSKQQFLS